MRSHSSLPRISPFGLSGLQPLRFIGYLMRAGDVMLLICARPRGQARRCGTSMVSSSCSSVLIFSGTPSSTYTLSRQRDDPQLQLFMQAPVFHSPFASEAGAPLSFSASLAGAQPVKPTSAAAPAVADPHLTKLRRVSEVPTFDPLVIVCGKQSPIGLSPNNSNNDPCMSITVITLCDSRCGHTITRLYDSQCVFLA